MKSLILRELNFDDESAFLSGLEEWKDEDLSWYSFVWKPGMSHHEHLKTLKDQKDKNKIAEDRVPSTMLYGFVEEKIVGRVSIRHELNDFLLERGGHIGYSVSPKFRQMGYATEMFRQALVFCKSLNLSRVLITCADENEASIKIIEHFGGILENKVWDESNSEHLRRYWLWVS